MLNDNVHGMNVFDTKAKKCQTLKKNLERKLNTQYLYWSNIYIRQDLEDRKHMQIR